MNIKEIFYKDINRPIQGVIKIGEEDDDNINQELEEYVVTRELHNHLDDFFSAYVKSIRNPTDKVGVWIAGFFGSGKSHFLKILSYILENRAVYGRNTKDYFENKIEDPTLKGNMALSGRQSQDVILFNIDSKADADQHNNKEAVITVLNKVFNDYMGYCGTIPWLAEFERSLDNTGKYDAFKQYYENTFGVSWIDDRHKVRIRKDNLLKAYNAATGENIQDSKEFLNSLQESYYMSPDDFARKIDDYINSKGKNHRIIFLIDEVGQYIGDNPNLMLSLQTITEMFGKISKGRAWIIVTSQQNIDFYMKVRGDDFSKITGRFDTRLSLSATNVDVVIKERLLKKDENKGVRETLKLKFLDNESIIKNLLIFSSRTPTMKTFKTAEDFIEVYPFVPYQFNLLQEVFNGIRTHGASGKHLSEGERSLLSAFQDAAVQYMNEEINVLIPFHAFYNPIATFLDHDINIVIQRAIDNDDLDDFDVNVLKLLFLIKYLGDKMPPNLENVTTLMVDNIHTDKLALSKQVQESTDKLYRQALIQKNGDAYIFLTNAEQDINSEIKNTEVNYSEVIKKLSEVVFDKILKAENKYAYTKDHVFTFNHKFDNEFYSSPKGEMTLQIVTPAFVDVGESDVRLKMITTQENTVIMRLPESMNYFEEMEEALKIETYLRRSNTKSSIPEVETIKGAKNAEIKTRTDRVAEILSDMISRAAIFVNGQKLDIKEKFPKARIDDSMKVLVESKYWKINMLTPFVPGTGFKTAFFEILKEKPESTLVDITANVEAYEEIQRHIDNMDHMSVPMTAKAITDKFMKEPYHWRNEDIKGLLLRMVNRQYITFHYAGDIIDRKEATKIVEFVSKDSVTESIKIKKKTAPPDMLIKKVREIMEEAFDTAYLPDDIDSMIDSIRNLLIREKSEASSNGVSVNIEGYLRLYKSDDRYPYPGRQILIDGKDTISEILNNNDENNFLNAIVDREERLLQYSVDVGPVKEFFKNKKDIFDKATHTLRIFKQSETFVNDTEAIRLIRQIEKILRMPNPYSHVYKIPELEASFSTIFANLLDAESELVKSAVEGHRESTLKSIANSKIPEDDKYALKVKAESRFKYLLDQLFSANNFRDVFFKKDEASKVKDLIVGDIEKIEKKKPVGPVVVDPPSKKIKRINLASYANTLSDIQSEEDIESIVDKFREYLKKELDENTIIKLI